MGIVGALRRIHGGTLDCHREYAGALKLTETLHGTPVPGTESIAMAQKSLFEDFIAQLNANVFLREFAFSRAQLRIAGVGEIEIADHIVLLDGLGLSFQLKERDATASATPAALEAWFRSKVLKKAVTQVKGTLRTLRQHAGKELTNDRGHKVEIPAALPHRFANLVLYRAPALSSGAAVRFHRSGEAGFIHVLPDVDYVGVCRYFVTPVELLDYLDFREQVFFAYAAQASSVSEAALVGQYLVDELGAIPAERYALSLHALRENVSAWDVSHFTENFADRITYVEGDASERAYYKPLAELAKLSRSELREFKTRLRLAIEAVIADRFELPYRFVCPRTDCGFLIVPTTAALRPKARTALKNLSLVSKHELQVFRQVGLSIWRAGEFVDIEWLFTEGANHPNPELDAALARNYPFRPTRDRMMPRYFFDTDTLESLLGVRQQ